MTKLSAQRVGDIRALFANIPGDVSNDAIGAHSATVEELYAPDTHASALAPSTPIVIGSRGTGKSFWAGALKKPDTKAAASKAYPKLRLDLLDVAFGYTGISGPDGISSDALNGLVKENATANDAKNFWWATILKAIDIADGKNPRNLSWYISIAADWENRETKLQAADDKKRKQGRTVLVIYDALDTVASTWPRRKLLTEALLEVVWNMRAYTNLKVKAFFRPDQIDDESLRFIELPKLKTGAVRLNWTGVDLYGLLFARLLFGNNNSSSSTFNQLLKSLKIETATRAQVLSRTWSVAYDAKYQANVMNALAGVYMASGTHGFKKGKTYDWPIKHLADAFQEVTPRSFLGLMRSAAEHSAKTGADSVLTPESIRHGLRAASRTRVDQLHQEFLWIKGVLAPLAGLLLPLEEDMVYQAWRQAGTIKELTTNAVASGYLPPYPNKTGKEKDLFEAMQRIGVMFRRKDERIDMPDLFRVAAKLLKKGSTAPLAKG